MKKVFCVLIACMFFVEGAFAENLWNTSFENDYGDYLYFDSKQLNNSTRTYDNFTYSQNSNYIEMARLDYTNKDRCDWICLEKSSSEECWINVELKKNQNAYSSKIYNYFLIEADFKADIFGCVAELVRIYPQSHCALKVTSDGTLVMAGQEMDIKLEKGKWVNIKIAVNINERTEEFYVNNELVHTFTKGPNSVTNVKSQLLDGTGVYYFDNYRITGLDNQYNPENEYRSDIFGDFENEKAFIENKIAFSAYGKHYYTLGERKELIRESVVKDNMLYVSLNDFNTALGTKFEYDNSVKTISTPDYSIDLEGNVSKNSEIIKTLSTAPFLNEGILYVPVAEFAENLLKVNKYTSYSEKTGLLIISPEEVDISDGEWNYPSMRVQTRMTLLNNLDFINNFVMYERPDSQQLKSDFEDMKNVHPRLILTAEKVAEIKKRAETDTVFSELLDRVLKTAKKRLDSTPQDFCFEDPLRMEISSLNRILLLGFAYNVTGEQRFAKRGWEELKAIAEFPDYNLASILDSATHNEILAFGYDWLYHGLSEEQRLLIEKTILEKSLAPLADGYYGRIFARGDNWSTLKWTSNMNAVANAGVITAAAAVIEKDEELCLDAISKALKSLEYTMLCFAPDGGWIEGTGYWRYACENLGYAMLTLKSVFGSYYGLENSQGFEKTKEAIVASIGPCGENPVGDTEPKNSKSYVPFGMLSEITGANLLINLRIEDLVTNPSNTVNPIDILMFKDYEKGALSINSATITRGTESFTIREDYNQDSENLYFTTHFGNTSGYHMHNDTGTFVLDILGERWAEDLGKDDYNLQNQLGYNAWELYRKRAEGHNVLLINPSQNKFEQKEDIFIPIKKYDSNENGGYVIADLSDAYEDAQSVKLGYYIGDNMRSVTTKYEMNVNENAQMYWFMHTKADIEIDGNTAYLSKNGKSIFLTFELDGADGELYEMNAEPIFESMRIPQQNQNEDYKKLAIKFSGSGAVKFSVKIAPANEGISEEILDTAMDDWKIE